MLTARDLSTHYTGGLRFFHEELVPYLKSTLASLSGGAWDFSEYEAYAAGSDVDLISHVVEAAAVREGVAVYPGDWYGFVVGSTHPERIAWTDEPGGRLACVCVPSVRNGHVTAEMVEFLERAPACLLNLNLYPTLRAEERASVARALAGVLERSMLSISFSRGFGLTASQLGVVLVHRDHPYRARFEAQWKWHTYFFNAIAARAFMRIDLAELQAVDAARREAAGAWLSERGLPAVTTGSYYVRSFRLETDPPKCFAPLVRDQVLRLCMKPSQQGVVGAGVR